MSAHQHFHNHNLQEREKILPSLKVLTHFGLKAGRRLADLGCGPGYFALKAAEIIGTQGQIKAVDINTERLEHLRQSAGERGLSGQIETYLAHDESVPLPDQDVEIALISNVLHELQDPLNYLRDARRVLKQGGEVWVIEFQYKETPMGPPLSERRPLEEWVTLLEQAGFEDIWVQIFHPAHILMRGKK